jgi:Hemerythrin HHE cation binding domain
MTRTATPGTPERKRLPEGQTHHRSGQPDTLRDGAVRGSNAATAPHSRPIDGLDLLAREHATIKRLFCDYERVLARSADHERRADAVCRICFALAGCLQVEDEVFYPAARAALGAGVLMDHALLDHRAGKKLMAVLDELEPDEEGFDDAMVQLNAYVTLHMQKVEDDVFPRVLLAGLDTTLLGQKIAARQRVVRADVTRAGLAHPAHAPRGMKPLAATRFTEPERLHAQIPAALP